MNAIDVIASQIPLGELLAEAVPGDTIGVARLSEAVCGKANRANVEQHGDYWFRTLVETAELGGVGRLERGRSGVVFRFAADLPGLDEAIGRALDAVA